MKPLNGRNVLITGSGSGIGRLMAHHFADERANVAVVDINAKSLEAVEAEVRERMVHTASYQCDITDQKGVSRVAVQFRKDFGPIDVLVNNAGTVIGKSFCDLTIEEMRRTMEINYWGHVYFTKEFLPDMLSRKSGALVHVASSSGLLGMPLLSDYAASKFAEVGFTESHRRELKKSGYQDISVTVVCPYYINTGMFKGSKPLLFNPFLEPGHVAKKIVAAVKQGKPLVLLPPVNMYSTMLLKLLPAGIFDTILKLSGGMDSMDSFVGRKS